MVKLGLLVRLEAKPGKEDDVAALLQGAVPLVVAEEETAAWFGVRLSPSTFAIFDVFEDEAGRDAHLSGAVASTLMAVADDLLTTPPSIERAEVLASVPADLQRARRAGDSA